MTFIKTISNPGPSDEELVARYKQSADLEVLAALYQRYMDLLYAVCLKYLREPETAKDAVMAVFEELAQKLPRFEVDNFRAWLYTMTKNHCLMQLRAGKKMKISEFDPDRMQMADDLHLNGVMEREGHLEKLKNCLETLSAEQKTTVELFYLQSKCYKEIETITGLNWNKVRSHIQNGRRNLKICIEKAGQEPVPSLIKTIRVRSGS